MVSGSATVTLGVDGAEAKAARAGSGGASPASGGATAARVDALPVLLAPEDGRGRPAHVVTVEVTSTDRGRAAGVAGPLLTLTDAEAPVDTQGPDGGREVQVTVDLAGLQGAAWADRARLVTLPACVLTDPDRAECRTRTPVEAVADARGATLTATVTLPAPVAAPIGAASAPVSAPAAAATQASPSAAQPMVLTAEPAPAGSGGSYAATSLAPSMAWTAGSNAGNFLYSYPIQVPPALGGQVPSVSLSYNSAAVDGRTSATNSQSSWIGDGWGYESGFIERSYQPCDKAGITGSGDVCWAGQNANLALGGHSGALIRDDATGVWHLQGDDGSKVEQLSGAPNGLNGGEYWRVTTSDGVQYYFGRNRLPGGDGTDPAAESALGVPVYSPNSGEPCYDAAKGKGSWCTMGWRWQLDYVVDPHQNLTTYAYAAETNHYSRGAGQHGGTGELTPYQRSAYLKQISYGQRLPEQVAAKGAAQPAARVDFTTAERCLPSGAVTCADSQRTAANAAFWPDVPIDQLCAVSGACANRGPSFFSTKRLTAISTSVLVGSARTTVDTWDLGQSFFDPGDGTPKTLWLDSVKRTGSNGRTAQSLPLVRFSAIGLANRVDGLVPAAPMFVRPRISRIDTETGGRINVNYSSSACSRVAGRMPSSEDGNTMACMPAKWYKPGSSTPVNDWFNKPLVTSVTEQDAVTGASAVKATEYTYHGTAAWHRNDAEYADPKTRTWDDFRGFEAVTTTTGSGYDGEAPKTQQKVTYLRGMDGDLKADGSTRSVQVASPLGGTVTDSYWLAGSTVATEIYDRAGGSVQSVKGSLFTGQEVTATQARSGDIPFRYARYPAAQVTAIAKTKLTDGSWRTTTMVSTSDPANGNRLVHVADKGDGTAATPETCTTNTYATATGPMLRQLIAQSTYTAAPCGTPATPANTISASRTLFDDKPFGQAGETGDHTGSLVLERFDGTAPVYLLHGTVAYDAYGRPTRTATTDGSTYDKDGIRTGAPTTTPAVTLIANTPATGALPTQVATTGPLGSDWTTRIEYDPGRGQALTHTDVNGRRTTEQHDALGRLTAVWEPDRSTTDKASLKYSYFVNGTTGPSAVMTEWLQGNGLTYSSKTELYDGLGRLRQTQQTSDAKPTGRLITDTAYDSHGWPVKASSPYYEASSLPGKNLFVPGNDSQVPAQSWISYDGMGRTVREEFRSYANAQWATVTAYPGADRTDVTFPQGAAPATQVADARGRVTSLWQYRTATPTGNPADADVTTYRYTPSGQSAGRTDSAGNTWTYRYDLRGRQIAADDPDTGSSTVGYDVNSRVERTTDARGRTVVNTFDLLGRKTAEYSGSVSPTNQLTGFVYDTLAKGQLTSSTRYTAGAAGPAYTKAVTGYDTVYRPLGTAVTIPAAEGALAGTYTTSTTYKPVTGALAALSVPAAGGLPAETLTYSYTDTGLLTGAMSGEQALVKAVAYDALGRPVRTTVGDYGTQVVSTQQYDWATGRVVNSLVDKQSGTVAVSQTGYTYTPSGRLTSVTDLQTASVTDTQCFTYDHLGRLTQAWTDTGGVHTVADWTDSTGVKHGTGGGTSVPGLGGCNNGSGPAAAAGGRTVGGPNPYWQSYTYDATGNRKSLTQHDLGGDSTKDAVTTQTFGPAGTVNSPTTAANTGGGTGGPHALLRSTTTSPTGTRTTGYQYDAAGNTTAITETGGTTSLAWDNQGKLTTLTKTEQASANGYIYDAEGNLLVRRNPGKSTLLLTTDQLTLDTASGSMSNVRYIGAPGGLSLTRVTAPIGGGTLFVQAADPHGTNGVQIACNPGQTVTRRPTDPFGNVRGTPPTPDSWAGGKGFVGGTKDDTTGLTTLGARHYDPATGRFISPDPLLDPADPQQWNAYAYANNDPVNHSDASGLIIDDCKEGRCGGGHYSPRAPEPFAPASFCATLQCAEQTSSWEYHQSNLKTQQYIATTISNGNGKGGTTTKAKSKDSGCIYAMGMRYNCGPSGSTGSSTPAAGSQPELLLGNYPLNNPNSRGCDTKVTCGIVYSVSFVSLAVAAVPVCAAMVLECAGLALEEMVSTQADSPIGVNPRSNAKGATGDALTAARRACKSFPPGTLVLLADGSAKPIEELTEGDLVAATDPQTGETAAKPVTDTILTPDDESFTDLTLAPVGATDPVDRPDQAVLTSTYHHPYWDTTTERWTNAGELAVGHQLLTPDGSTLTVTATRTYRTNPQPAYNLTVADLHTYYVLAGNTPVLVHNTGPGCGLLEGERDYDVYHPTTGNRITDIDHVGGGVLWEEKSALYGDDAWISKQIDGKLKKYIEARQYMPGYENAPIGFRLTNPSIDPRFRSALESHIDNLRQANPGVDIRLEFAQ
ncbi:polymorphic toxin-type HINT domain-containing protein [Kitasatospora sp. NPDC092286]|uniref:polymorphic toxin-type HINT domain-containing protein n=1 Tax=Kitasatospora sp. NPDC092286 TaxID=3364087 RepID=UPI0037FA07A1